MEARWMARRRHRNLWRLDLECPDAALARRCRASLGELRCQPPLRLDGREVLDVVADEAAQILDEPVEQRRKVQRVAGRPGVVVGGLIDGSAVLTHASIAIARAGERDEHRRPELLPSGVV